MKIFVDCSGSTGSNSKYWDRVSQLIESNKSASFFFWDDICRKYSYTDAVKHVNSRRGIGGTYPNCFVREISNSDSIIIITDGQVSESDVKKCDDIMNRLKLSDVTVEFIDTGGSMNLSVAAPFTRNANNINIVVNSTPLHSGNTSDPIDLTIYATDPEKFIAEYEQLYKKIVMKTVGKRDDNLRNQLLDLQKNLLRVIASRIFDASSYDRIREKLIEGDFNTSVELLESIINASDKNIAITIENFIQTLCKQCEGNTGYSFSLLQPGRLTRASTVTDTNIAEAPSSLVYNGSFECPIALDTDIPVLLVAESEPILNTCDKNLLEEIMNNPLVILNQKDLCDKFVSMLDHPIGLDAARQLANRSFVSPITRRPIMGCLSFYNEKTNESATMYTLAKMLFGQKLVGNPDLWLIVTYNLIRKSTYLSDNIELINMCKSYIINRIKSTRTNITLSGLPIEPMIKAPTDIAIWYCVTSPYFYRNLSEDDSRNRLRSMGSVAKYLIEIVELLGYPFDKKFTLNRLDLYHALALMQNMLKNNIDIKSQVRSLYQNCLYKKNNMGTVDFVFFDGPVSNPFDIFGNARVDLKLSLEEIYGLSKLLDRSKVNSSIMIPYDFVGTPLPKFTVNYTYRLYDYILARAAEINSSKHEDLQDLIATMSDTSPEICPKTLRPYTIDRIKNKHWLECSEELHGPVSKQLSTNNYFIEYVTTKRMYPPSKEDFMVYMYQRQLGRLENSTDTLPMYTWNFVDCLYNRYANVLNTMSPYEFARIAEASRDKQDRMYMETH